jgi:hypothetical protein
MDRSIDTGPILCPFCEEPTLPNCLADGTIVCSCAAERMLDGAVAANDQRSVPQGAGYQPKPSPSAATWPMPGKAK